MQESNPAENGARRVAESCAEGQHESGSLNVEGFAPRHHPTRRDDVRQGPGGNPVTFSLSPCGSRLWSRVDSSDGRRATAFPAMQRSVAGPTGMANALQVRLLVECGDGFTLFVSERKWNPLDRTAQDDLTPQFESWRLGPRSDARSSQADAGNACEAVLLDDGSGQGSEEGSRSSSEDSLSEGWEAGSGSDGEGPPSMVLFGTLALSPPAADSSKILHGRSV